MPTMRACVNQAGGCSGIVSRTMTAPLDRIKIMIQAGAPGEGVKQWEKNKIRNAVRAIRADSGILGFWRGNGNVIIVMCISQALLYLLLLMYICFARMYL